MIQKRLKYLIEQYTQKRLTADERAELLRMLQEVRMSGLPVDVASFVEHESATWSGQELLPLDTEALLSAIFAADRVYAETNAKDNKTIDLSHRPRHRAHFLRRWSWAAAIILFLGAGAYLYTTSKKTTQPLANGNKPLQTDILPGTNKALLTLSDGTTITLDSAANGAIAQQGNSSIIKLSNGEIVYNLKGAARGEVMMNTMSTPRGGQYQLTLPDGSKVWLNAASSIRYPAMFVGKQRKIQITGEAYLEVAKDQSRPFMVDINGASSVEVLGTSFNINSYADDGNIMTTLIEGAVKVSVGNDATILKPLQQAVVTPAVRQLKVLSANMNQVLAWKNGFFNMEGTSMKGFMRQLERWYDIEVRYEGEVPDITFRGQLNRDVPLSDIVKYLNSLDIGARMEGKLLVIKDK